MASKMMPLFYADFEGGIKSDATFHRKEENTNGKASVILAGVLGLRI